MKYSDLVTVLTIYQEHSFTAAANKLYISQPAISQIVAHLEKELNLLLFVRNKGEITPTPACERFVAHAADIIDQWKRLEKEMKLFRPDNILQIGTTSFFFRFLSYKTEALFSSDHRELQYNIIEDTAKNIEQMTHEGKLDFCFTRAPLHQSSLKCEPLFTEEILFVLPASHPICQQYPSAEREPVPVINLTDFRFSDFIMVNNARITPLCQRMCENAGFQPKITVSPVTWEHVLMGIRSGLGVGFLSNLHIKKDASADLRFFHIDSPLAKMEHVVAYRTSYHLGSQARYFIDSFRTYVQNSIESF